MAKLGKTNGGVVAEPIGEKVIDHFGRASLQDIQIDARVEKQGTTDRRLVPCPGQSGIWPPFQPSGTPLWLEGTQRAP
jgi:hypothetical protein